MRTSLALLLLASLTLTACGGTTTEAPQPTDAGDQTMSAEEALILQQVNEARAQSRRCGDVSFAATTPVTWNGFLAAAARAHADDMATRGYFEHLSPEGEDMQARAEAAGYTNWRELGENLATGHAGADVMAAWLASESHCRTIMNPKFRELGVGYVNRPGSVGVTYWVQVFGTR
ncbi:CAP domain-containing protein [Deinococcus sp. YIM 134068]|uniref:CAP domain-containing protein n=1 Tax=Deinococcus lichenicola TaxID=3118910 RepID=UPI002F94E123